MAEEIDVKLFGLETSQDLRIDFPQLATNEHFKDLKPREVKFCWLVGNRTSPLFEKKDVDKIKMAVKICYPNYLKKEELKDLFNGSLPDYLHNGIEAMKNFNPEIRLRTTLMQHYIFDELNYIVGMKTREDLSLMSNDELKKYSDLIRGIEKDLPDMIKRIEGANGISLYKKDTKKRILVNINDGITAY